MTTLELGDSHIVDVLHHERKSLKPKGLRKDFFEVKINRTMDIIQFIISCSTYWAPLA